MNLYFLQNYNNYFNRIVKPTAHIYTLQEFEAAGLVPGEAAYFTDISFNFNDDVQTTQILNWNYGWTPDYMLLIDPVNESIHSTWFVIDAVYTRNGQYKVSLKRDVVNDFYNSVISAPCFVEKATITDPRNPLLYNDEGMHFNQIKTEETRLFDETDSGWIVGYVAKPQENEADVPISASTNIDYDYTWSAYPYKDFIWNNNTRFTMRPKNLQISITTRRRLFDRVQVLIDYNNNAYDSFSATISEADWSNTQNVGPYLDAIGGDINDTSNAKAMQIAEIFNGGAESLLNSYKALGPDDGILGTNGCIIYDTEQEKYFRIKISYYYTQKRSPGYYTNDTSAEAVAFKSAMSDLSGPYTLNGGTCYMGFATYDQDHYHFELEEITTETVDTKISAGRRSLLDAPYDIFAIPYGRVGIQDTGRSGWSSAEVGLNIAHNISEKLGTKLYDMQLLPYCPCRTFIMSDKLIDVSAATPGIDYNLITSDEGATIQSIILWAQRSSDTFTVPFNHFVEEPKVENECDMWRIVSPNYQGMFEFSAAKNFGIDYFTIDFTYKPYNPYIHVAPNWGGLYGSNFGDARGLVCGGDFSVATVSDAFKQYEINNKNYQNIFDRGIQNLDVNRKYDVVNQFAQATVGAAQGAMMGAFFGGGAGAAVGATASALGGAADIAVSAAKFKEQKSYQTDLYKYKLGNTKAMPDSLTKASALTITNKIVPFVEYYTCTDKEKEALRKKITYNGMTVMTVDNISNYLGANELNYIQGQLIRIEYAEDPHVANAIYDEIKRGVFMTLI